MNSEKLNWVIPSKAKMLSFAFIGIGLIGMIYGFITDDVAGAHHYHHDRFWANFLMNSFFFMSISLAATFFLGLQYAAEAGWATSIKRVIEAVTCYLPYGLALMLIVFVCCQLHVNDLYIFMDPEVVAGDEILQAKMGYFGPFWWIRTVLYIVIWILFQRGFRKRSIEADMTEGHGVHWVNFKKGAIFMVLFGVTSSTSSWDWVMALDPHWFSTLFGWYIFSGMWVSACTVIVMIIIWLRRQGYLEFVTESTIHDMGKWMFAISFLWTYLYFSQFMLYWYSNIPEEVRYFLDRWKDYKALMWIVFAINFAFPMALLMSRDSKRNFFFLSFVGIIILIGHWLDIYMIVMPPTV
ncbi:MAG: quinol:cytochrome C oxidoreductase, partial [Bacteroidia bacterium]|nr:quinol:cytochrome C oxidoreductase [Bacteroidia bacterium]